MLSTMPDFPLTIGMIFRHGRTMNAASVVTSYAPDGSSQRRSFADVAAEADRLAVGLQAIGVAPGDRVGTLCWNSATHLAAYFAVPCLGAVLHTLNLRLSADQLTYVIEHGEDRVVLVDDSLVDLLAALADDLSCVERFVVVGDADPAVFGERGMRYADLLGPEGGEPAWPEVDELSAASMCYTSGTTGNPRGVAYGHRSTFVHSLAQCAGSAFALSERDRILLMVPMFHANAWGLPYSGWMVGADLIMPGRTLDGASLARMIEECAPTFTAGVPTLLSDLLRHAEREGTDLSCLREVLCGGAPVPPKIIDAFRDRHGVAVLQGWGMTETSPLAAMAHPPRDAPPEEDTYWRSKSGRPIAGVEMRIVDAESGEVLAWDGATVGEIEVRGPWVTVSYHRDAAPEKFRDGWLRTGDVGYGDARGYVQLTDRTKDVIKSGGEWISSVELENELMEHPGVVEAAVIAVADERWSERPLACVVLSGSEPVDPAELAAFLEGRVAKWWIPERWAFVDEVPKTSVGKYDKKLLRAQHAEGRLEVAGAGG